MSREKLVLKVVAAQLEFDFAYNKGVRAATAMGALQSKIDVAKAELDLADAQYKIN